MGHEKPLRAKDGSEGWGGFWGGGPPWKPAHHASPPPPPPRSHFGVSYGWSVAGSAATRDALRREVERREIERRETERRERPERLALLARAHEYRDHEVRVQALRSMHRVPMTPVVWEIYRDQADPGGALHAEWDGMRMLAIRVLAHDTLAYREALTMCGCLLEVHSHVGEDGVRVSLVEGRGHLDLRAPLGDVIPAAAGAEGVVHTEVDRLDIYQDYVCGLALRVARELLAVLPLADVSVDVWNTALVRPAALPPAGGYREAPAPTVINTRVASVLCPREAMDAIAWSSADASVVFESLRHEMDFRPGQGFYEVGQVERPDPSSG